jgi:hypothetical protein
MQRKIKNILEKALPGQDLRVFVLRTPLRVAIRGRQGAETAKQLACKSNWLQSVGSYTSG